MRILLYGLTDKQSKTLESIPEPLKYELDQAFSSEEAIAFLRSNSYGLILLAGSSIDEKSDIKTACLLYQTSARILEFGDDEINLSEEIKHLLRTLD